MRLGFITTFNNQDVHKRSGTPYYMAKSLEYAGIELDYIGSLKTKLPPGFKFKRFWKKIISDQQDSSRFNTYVMKQYAHQVEHQLSRVNVQAVIAHILNPVAYLNCKQPIVLWTDAVYAGLIGFYAGLSYHSADTIKQANAMTAESLARARLAIFSSEWAARNAIEFYGAEKEKIHVVPFGANIASQHTYTDVKEWVQKRPRDCVNLLFLGKEWERKGGDIVLAVAHALHNAGIKVKLTIVGCKPQAVMPDYVNCLGYISKKNADGNRTLEQLLRESHFLCVPSRAEAYGIVFCEASAYGLPSLTSYVGGIGSVVSDHVNGMKFPLDCSVDSYCHYITELMQNFAAYEALALSAFNHYEQNLNWQVAANRVKNLIQTVV